MTGIFKSRQSVYGRACVSSSQPLASAAGLQVLAAGGNAADAAIATAAVLAVTEPTSNGLGGDFIALHHHPRISASPPQRDILFLGAGRSPASLTAALFPTPPVAPSSPHTVTVPGAVAAWHDLKLRCGSSEVSWARLLQPAIRAARDGFYVHRTTAALWKGSAAFLRAVDADHPYLPAPEHGELFRNPALARVLQEVAEDGPRAFYKGRVAHAIGECVRAAGGVLSDEDIAAHETEISHPLEATFAGWRVLEADAPTHGVVALLAMRVLQRVWTMQTERPIRSANGGNSAEFRGEDRSMRTHLQVEALRLAFATAAPCIADGGDLNSLLGDDVVDGIARRIALDRRAALDDLPGATLTTGGTVQFCVIDEDGAAVSAVQSNYMGFGTGLVPRDCGFTLQNRGLNFATAEGHPNVVGGGKRPYHTIIPGMMVRETTEAEEVVAFGVMGSFMQPQGHVIVASALLTEGAGAQEALDVCRFRVTGSFSSVEEGMGDDAVLVEEDMEECVKEGLRQRGHDVRVGSTGVFGRGHVVRRTADGRVEGGADCRGDGVALVDV